MIVFLERDKNDYKKYICNISESEMIVSIYSLFF
jgi:hypothetical protein